jgi:methionyl-tRNA formyltransferase
MRAIFFGTPEIAVPALRALHRSAELTGVVCQPDRPSGRGLMLHAPAVKLAARELGVPVVQPTKIRTPDFEAWVREQAADVAVVLAYGRILPPGILSAPRRGSMNLHASILPRLRGAAPINWAIVRGDRETGVSLMQMDEGLDTGPVYAVRRIAIGDDETAGELSVRLGDLAAEVVLEDLPSAVSGATPAVPQTASEATVAPLLEKKDGAIDWSKPSQQVHDHVRGMTPWPGAFTHLAGKLLKVLATRCTTFSTERAAPGTIVVADSDAVLVACGDRALRIERAQVEGRKALDARDLVAGRTFHTGARFD